MRCIENYMLVHGVLLVKLILLWAIQDSITERFV